MSAKRTIKNHFMCDNKINRKIENELNVFQVTDCMHDDDDDDDR